jgi:hypothetical protein
MTKGMNQIKWRFFNFDLAPQKLVSSLPLVAPPHGERKEERQENQEFKIWQE